MDEDSATHYVPSCLTDVNLTLTQRCQVHRNSWLGQLTQLADGEFDFLSKLVKSEEVWMFTGMPACSWGLGPLLRETL